VSISLVKLGVFFVGFMVVVVVVVVVMVQLAGVLFW
jgi:hypothetical protein